MSRSGVYLQKEDVLVGFGIRNAEQAAKIGYFSDAVVVGSAFVECIEHTATPHDAINAVHGLARELAEGLR